MLMKRLIEILNEMRTWVPFRRTENQSVTDVLREKFSVYQKCLKDVDEDDFKKLFSKNNSMCKLQGKKEFINLIGLIQQTVINSLSVYAEGNPSQAYEIICSLLGKNKVIQIQSNCKPKYFNNKLCEYLEHYFKFNYSLSGFCENFYRMRISDIKLLKDGMFHISIKTPEKISTQRFSIPGYPCLYLGSSLNVCWDEIGREMESEEKVYACRFEKERDELLTLLSLKIPDEFTENNCFSYESFCFLLTFPFYLACLIQTREPVKPFKPEYIIPQLLLQYVNDAYKKCSVRFDGIVYPSTKHIPFNGNNYNVVLPYRPCLTIKEDEEYSFELIKKLPYTEVVEADIANLKNVEEILKQMELECLNTVRPFPLS